VLALSSLPGCIVLHRTMHCRRQPAHAPPAVPSPDAAICSCLQDVFFEAANITTCFKALATVDQPDDDVSRAQQTAFLEELCSLAHGALPALRPSQLVTLLWSCGR